MVVGSDKARPSDSQRVHGLVWCVVAKTISQVRATNFWRGSSASALFCAAEVEAGRSGAPRSKLFSVRDDWDETPTITTPRLSHPSRITSITFDIETSFRTPQEDIRIPVGSVSSPQCLRITGECRRQNCFYGVQKMDIMGHDGGEMVHGGRVYSKHMLEGMGKNRS